ncbi:MAG: hypothetical protein HYW49_05685 [Deltaproteobacteria bacterium]|nr:hypothetical protein [Deltaproteobacteria bacterium]
MRTKLQLMVFAALALAAVPAIADESGAPVFDLTPDEGQVTNAAMPQAAPQADAAQAPAAPAMPTEVTAAPAAAPTATPTVDATAAAAPKKSQRKPASVKSPKKSRAKSSRRPASNRFLSDESRNALEAEVAAKGAKIQDADLSLAQAILKNVESTYRCVHKEIEKIAAVGAKYRVVYQCENKVRSRVYFRIYKKKLRFSAVQLRYNKAEDGATGQTSPETTAQPVQPAAQETVPPAATQETVPQTPTQ